MKKIALLLVVLNLFQHLLSYSQTTFQKYYGSGGGFGSQTKAYSIVQTNDGGYLSAGHTLFGGTTGIGCYLIKTNSLGDTLWTKTIGGTPRDFVYSMIQNTDGSFVMTGSKTINSSFTNDIFIMKLNSTGDTLWTKCLGNTPSAGRSIQRTNDGGYVITGSVSNGVDDDVVLLKTNSVGDTLWTRKFGGTGNDYGYCVKQTSDGGFIIAGNTTSFGAGNSDVLLFKTDSSGLLTWSKTYGRSGDDYGMSITLTTDGNYMIAGTTDTLGNPNNDMYLLIKTDLSGNVLWSKTLGTTGYNEAQSIEPTTDGNYIITGLVDSLNTSNALVVGLIKINNSGDTLWTKKYNRGEGYSVKQTNDGGFIIGCSTNQYAANGIVYLIKTDANGNTGCMSYSANVKTDTVASIVTSPTLIESSGLPLYHPVISISSVGQDVTTLCFTSGINELTNSETITLYPNPATTTTTFTIESTNKIQSIKVINVIGEVISTTSPIGNNKTTIDLTGVAKGIYFVQITDENKTIVNKKIVVQ